MTELFVLDPGGGPLPETAELLLPDWRRERMAGIIRPGARQESLAAGLLWRFAMLRRGVPPDAEVRILPAGKPVLAGREDIWFSLSHSGGYALCAVSGCPVGTDVQERRPVNSSMSRYFHPAERVWLAEMDGGTSEAFFRLWTRKEAWVKAVSGDRVLSLAEADVIHPPPGMHFRDYDLPGGCQAALCAGEEDICGPLWIGRAQLLSEDP